MFSTNLSKVEFYPQPRTTVGYLETRGEAPTLDDILAGFRFRKYGELTQRFLSDKREELSDLNRILPSNPYILLQLGEIHLMRNNFPHARRIFSDIINNKKDFYPAYERLILANLLMNEFDEVDKIYNKYLEISQRRTKVMHEYVLFRFFYKGFRDSDNVTLCQNILNELIQKDPENYLILNTYGLFLLSTGNLEASKCYFEKSLKRKPDFLHANNNIGIYFVKQGNFEEAKVYFQKALKKDLSFLPAHENMLQALLLIKDLTGAEKWIKKIDDIGLDLPIRWKAVVATVLVEAGKIKSAISLYLQYLEIDNDNPYILNNLGYCYLIGKQIPQAESCLEKSYKILRIRGQLTKSPIVLYNLGRLAYTKRNFKKVREIADEILYYFSNDSFGLWFSAAYLIHKKRYEEARNVLYKALENKPDIIEIYTDLGFILAAVYRDHVEALRVMNIAVEKKIASALILNNMAYSWAKTGNIKKAEEILTKIKKPFFPVYFATKGLIEIRKGFLNKGEKLYQQAISRFDNDDAKTIAKQLLKLEKAYYYLNRNNPSVARKHLDEGLALGDSYVNSEISSLLEKM